MMMDGIQHGLARDTTSGRYTIALKGLSRGEALELMTVVRRLELYRTTGIATDIVESAMQAMARFEVDNKG